MPAHLLLPPLLVSLASGRKVLLRLRRHHRQVGRGAYRVVPGEGRVETRRHRRRRHRQRRRQRDVQGRSGRRFKSCSL